MTPGFEERWGLIEKCLLIENQQKLVFSFKMSQLIYIFC